MILSNQVKFTCLSLNYKSSHNKTIFCNQVRIKKWRENNVIGDIQYTCLSPFSQRKPEKWKNEI